RTFAAKGYNLVFNGLEENGAEIAAGVAKEHNIEAFFSPANMLNPEMIRDMVAQAEERFGKVDVLINNAGVQHVAPIDEFPESKWDLIIGVNLSSAFHTSKAVWPGMKKRGFGRIINIASVHGIRASEYKAAYISAKHGIIGLTKALALEGAPLGITCNAICPGYVRTPLVEGQIGDQARSHGMTEEEVVEKIMLKKQAVKDFVPIKLLAEMALLLASKEAQTLTGTAQVIDGGWSAQ
ncbi:MAG: 3-hydroxybutyrate dehydrogenase, partial [Phaeodactylibacter sp.]|nr:3-hydroxybutyrate dehydrogenase [Phaeodactylibacter sp.]